VYHLPNRKFFPYLDEMSEADLISTVRSVLIYGSLQLISFITLLVVLTRRFQLAPGAILRFVLLYDWRLVQGQFVLWIIYVLQSSIQHVGTQAVYCSMVTVFAHDAVHCMIQAQITRSNSSGCTSSSLSESCPKSILKNVCSSPNCFSLARQCFFTTSFIVKQIATQRQ
jgi:hypothetical protein